MVEKVSNKRATNSKVSLQAMAKVCGVTTMGCQERHTTDFTPGVEKTHISQRRIIPIGMASISGLCKTALPAWQQSSIRLPLYRAERTVLQPQSAEPGSAVRGFCCPWVKNIQKHSNSRKLPKAKLEFALCWQLFTLNLHCIIIISNLKMI